MTQPIVFAAPADVDLGPNPVCPDWIIEGKPEARSKVLAASSDGASSIVAWSCTAGRFDWHYAVDETLHIISGEAFVTDEKGEVHRLGPGDVVFFPAGSHSRWFIPREVRKLAFCRHSMPRPAGLLLKIWNRLYYKLTGFPLGGGVGQTEEEFAAELRGERDGEAKTRTEPAKAA